MICNIEGKYLKLYFNQHYFLKKFLPSGILTNPG